jgi:hypothetical protein
MIAAVVLAAAITLSPSADTQLPQLTAPASAPVMQGQATPYKGHYWIKAQRKYTLCVLHYESRSNWFSTARADGYFGGFKFTKALTSGATWMMTKELRDIFGDVKGRKVARELRATEMHKWLPFYQHMAFATVLNWEGAGSGQSHWAAQRKRCFL